MSFAFFVIDARALPATRWLPAVEAALPFPAGRHVRFTAGGFEVHGWPARGAAGGLERWHEEGPSAACFGGYGLDVCGRAMSARELAGCADAAEARARFHGEWTAAVRRPDGRIWAGSSAFGGGHLYTAAGRPAMLSTHARLLWSALHALGRPPSPDWRALSWLLTAGWMPEVRRTAAAGVELVPAHEAVEIEPVAGVANRRELGGIERAAEPPGSPVASWGELGDRLVRNLHWAGEQPGPLSVALTGGKDSRLVAAAIRSAGLAGRCRFFTVGRAGQPDVVVAGWLAAALGAEAEVVPPPAVTDLPAALRRHVTLTEGTVGAWDLKGQDEPSPAIEIHGLFGEVYRRSHPTVAADPAAFAAARTGGGLDLFGLLEPAHRDAQRTRLVRWLDRLLDRGMAIDRAEDAFYLELRYPRWASAAQQSDAHRTLPLNPLLHPDLVAACLRLPVEDRWLERLHFETLSHLAPDLATIPFADRSWRDGLEGRIGRPLPRQSVSARGSWLGIGWQVPALRRQWPLLRSRILDRAGELAPLTGRERLERHVDLAEAAIARRPTLRSLRRGLREPRLLRFVRGHRRPAVAATLSLLTLLALLDELREAPAAGDRSDA